jgi:glycosyltransferase involved in cell wall biosynthesis
MDKTGNTLLVFHTAYNFKEMKSRQLEIFYSSNLLGEFFDKIIFVHPFANYSDYLESKEIFSGTTTNILNSRLIFIEGSTQRFKWLSRLFKVNFIIAQLDLFLKLRSYLRSNSITFIRAEDPRLMGIWGVVFSKILRRPLLIGSWGNPDLNRMLTGGPMYRKFLKWNWLEVRIERYVLPRATLGLAQNRDNLNFLLRNGVKEANARIFPLGNAVHQVHFSEPSTRQQYNLVVELKSNPNLKILGCVSALERRKIIEDVLLVTSYVKNFFDVRVIIAGDGSARAYYEALTLELGISQEVIFLGNIDQLSLANLLPKIDVMLSPLTGRALVESLLSETPIVAYDIDGHSELIVDGDTGLLVPFRDWKSMANSAVYLLGNTEISENLGKNGRRLALEKMNPEEIIIRQKRVYQDIS